MTNGKDDEWWGFCSFVRNQHNPRDALFWSESSYCNM
jgi:hypothetical protein